ncbi:myelin-associated glycoprotein [Anoplopoma fimbria]|uniref:myelin-associated glycoprotein n=1 Tax=Anoplopoma fimbria TaxID=229290 RepID=UPI0023EB6AA8|nr:myelin-associated glycoprotein [Anoplopoma fimbria]
MGVVLAVDTLLIALMQAVFCKTWEVTLPQKVMGISDSCVDVPCHFDVPKELEANIVNCSDGGIWSKGNMFGPPYYTDRNPSINNINGRTLGDLTKKNCTTMFYSFPKNFSDMYFFRIDCLNNLKFSFRNGVMINIPAEVPPPELTPVGQVSEGEQVRLQCSVLVPCSILPPSITWLPRDNSRQEETQMQQESPYHQTMMTSTLTFNASADHHNQSVTCSVSYPLTKGGSSQPSATTLRLNILYAPRVIVATLSTSVPVSEGRVVTFTCWSDANPPVSLYTWYRVDRGQLTKMGEEDLLVLKVSQEDSGAYLCEARTQRGSKRSRPVTLEVIANTGSSHCVEAVPYLICGVLLVLYILTVVVDVYKYQSISRRLKQIELKGERTYTDLKTSRPASDYDQLQGIPCTEAHNYENPITLKASYINLPPPKTT